MAQARRGSSSPLLALNEGLDDILIATKDANRKSSSSENLKFDEIEKAYDKYFENLPPPGSMLTSIHFRVLFNLRQILDGSFSIFESRAQRFIENYGDFITILEKGHRKRPAGKETVRNREATDSFASISMIAQACASPLTSIIEPLEDFDLETLFKKKGNKDGTGVTMEDVPPCPVLPALEKEFQPDPLDVYTFEQMMTEVDERGRRAPAEVPPLPTASINIDEAPVFPTDFLRAADSEMNLSIPDAQRRSAGVLLPDITLPDAMNVAFPEKAPAQISPPDMAGVPRLALEEATVSREREPLVVEVKRLVAEMAAKKALETKSKKISHRKGLLPPHPLKQNSCRVNTQLSSARVNKIMDKRSTVNVPKQKWRLVENADPFSSVKCLQDAEACVYQYKYWKKYPLDLPEDEDEVDLMVQCLQEELIKVTERTPLRAYVSTVSEAIEGQTPQRHAAPTPSPRQPVMDQEIRAELMRDEHTPLLPVPSPSGPVEVHTPLLPVTAVVEEGRRLIGRRVVDPEIQAEFIGDEHSSSLAVPVPSRPAQKRREHTPLLPLPTPVEEEDAIGRRAVAPEIPVEFMEDGPLLPVSSPSRAARKRSDEIQTEVEESGIPVEAELSDATRAQNAYEKREQLRITVVGKLKEEFTNDPSVVLAFTDLCPLSSTKHLAAETFFILLELWEEGEVSLSQESLKPQDILIRVGKRHNSSTETCSDSTTS